MTSQNYKKNQNEFLNIVYLSIMETKQFYKKRCEYLEKKFVKEPMHAGFLKINCETTISDMLSFCIPETSFAVQQHNLNHQAEENSSMAVNYDINKNSLQEPTACSCQQTIEQKNDAFFLKILFVDSITKSYTNSESVNLFEFPEKFFLNKDTYTVER